MKPAFLLAMVALVAGTGAASAQDWHYDLTLYAWVPGLSVTTDTDYGSVSSDKSPSDTLSALDMAFMGHIGAQNGKLGLVGDLMYADLSASKASPFGKLFSEATFGTKLTAVSGYALYRLADDPKIQFDAGVGFRYFDLQFDTTLTGNIASTWERSTSTSWVDPLIAARLAIPLNDKWLVNGFADWGGTGDSETWQIYAGVTYKINDNWSTQAGWRYMNVNKDVGDTNANADLDLSGPVFGMTYSF